MILIILARRGLFQLTRCNNCNYLFECNNCDAKLVTYRSYANSLELICHQCQSYYKYPNKCPACHKTEITSAIGGIEKLEEVLVNSLELQPIRLDKAKSLSSTQKLLQQAQPGQIFLTTRVFDPGINYALFSKVILLQAESLQAGSDYLTTEESLKNLADLTSSLPQNCKLIFDTVEKDEFLPALKTDLGKAENTNQIWLKYLQKEHDERVSFGFPPATNLLLLTSQEKTRDASYKKMQGLYTILEKELKTLPNLELAKPYPAKFLKRKNYFSYHLLIKYPRSYAHFAKLRKSILEYTKPLMIQVRLNPRHLF